MAALLMTCGICQAELRSVHEAQEHAELTGHTDFAESREPVLNLVCRTCGKPCRKKTECDLHTKRTGHEEFDDKNSEAAKPVSLDSKTEEGTSAMEDTSESAGLAAGMALKIPSGVNSQSGGNSAIQRPRIILAASGSVAAIKFGILAHSISDWAEVRAVGTKSALHFIDQVSLPTTVKLYTDEDEWSSWSKIGDDVLHIELRKWADAIVIAPLSANTLAKVAGGLCDNLLTCIIRAWDYSKPVFVAPAMNTFMWDNPFTQKHLESVKDLGFAIISPITKKLACGDYGNGAMAEPSVIDSTLRLSMHNRDSQVKPMVLDSV